MSISPQPATRMSFSAATASPGAADGSVGDHRGRDRRSRWLGRVRGRRSGHNNRDDLSTQTSADEWRHRCPKGGQGGGDFLIIRRLLTTATRRSKSWKPTRRRPTPRREKASDDAGRRLLPEAEDAQKKATRLKAGRRRVVEREAEAKVQAAEADAKAAEAKAKEAEAKASDRRSEADAASSCAKAILESSPRSKRRAWKKAFPRRADDLRPWPPNAGLDRGLLRGSAAPAAAGPTPRRRRSARARRRWPGSRSRSGAARARRRRASVLPLDADQLDDAVGQRDEVALGRVQDVGDAAAIASRASVSQPEMR